MPRILQNVEKAREVGHSVLDSMTAKSATEFSCKRNNQVMTFNAKSSIKVDGEKTQVDPQLVFQRLSIARQSLDDMRAMQLSKIPVSFFLPATQTTKASIGR